MDFVFLHVREWSTEKLKIGRKEGRIGWKQGRKIMIREIDRDRDREEGKRNRERMH